MSPGVYSPEPFPQAGAYCANGANCIGNGLVHPYDAHMRVNNNGGQVCGVCNKRDIRHAGRDPRQILRNFFFKHGHGTEDEATEESGVEYVTLETANEAVLDDREELHGGPETLFKCERCGRNLHVAGEKSVLEVLGPLGYTPPPGTIAPVEPIVALACPNDGAGGRHTRLQIRSSMLGAAMAREDGHD